MKFIFFVSALLLSYLSSQSQWDEPGNGIIYYNDGNVGIGTSSPHPNGRLSISTGNIFMRSTTAPAASGIFSTNTIYLSDNQYLDIASGTYKAASAGPSNRLQLLYNNGLSFFNGSSASTDAAVTNTEVFRLSNNGGLSLGSSFVGTDPGPGNAIISGHVGIGTTSTGTFKLAVDGKIGARKVVVTQTNPWPDYVFHATYRLRPLSEVEQYIQQHNHLPDVPSAIEVETNGIDLGDNQALLLKKIEELTLYIIDINKKVDKLAEENEKLKKKLAATNQ